MKRSFAALMISLCALAGVAAPAAADLSDRNLLVPVAGRTAGAHSTQWRTDLVVTNLEATPVRLFVTLHQGETAASFTDKLVPAYGTLVLRDVLRDTLGVEDGTGLLRVNTTFAGARLTARAYIYNRGTAGEFGQGLPAIPVDALGQDHVLTGIVQSGETRTNIGVANPWATDTDVILSLHSAEGDVVGQYAMTVPAESVLQFAHTAALWGLTSTLPAAASVRVLASLPVYPYASVVRNDTGDAVFVAGSGISRTPGVISPTCAEPSPLIQPWRGEEPAEETTIEFVSGTTAQYIESLAVQHGFTITQRFGGGLGIAAVLTPQQIAALRCAASVKVLRRDGAMATGN